MMTKRAFYINPLSIDNPVTDVKNISFSLALGLINLKKNIYFAIFKYSFDESFYTLIDKPLNQSLIDSLNNWCKAKFNKESQLNGDLFQITIEEKELNTLIEQKHLTLLKEVIIKNTSTIHKNINTNFKIAEVKNNKHAQNQKPKLNNNIQNTLQTNNTSSFPINTDKKEQKSLIMDLKFSKLSDKLFACNSPRSSKSMDPFVDILKNNAITTVVVIADKISGFFPLPGADTFNYFF